MVERCPSKADGSSCGRVRFVNAAVADKSGFRVLSLPIGNGLGAEPLGPAHATLGQPTWSDDANTVALNTSCTSLDELAAELERKLLTVDFIKIDVEGAELLVLRGAAHILRTHAPDVIVEIAWSEKYFGVPGHETIALLAEYGYRGSTSQDSDFFAVKRSSPELVVVTTLSEGQLGPAEEAYVGWICAGFTEGVYPLLRVDGAHSYSVALASHYGTAVEHQPQEPFGINIGGGVFRLDAHLAGTQLLGTHTITLSCILDGVPAAPAVHVTFDVLPCDKRVMEESFKLLSPQPNAITNRSLEIAVQVPCCSLRGALEPLLTASALDGTVPPRTWPLSRSWPERCVCIAGAKPGKVGGVCECASITTKAGCKDEGWCEWKAEPDYLCRLIVLSGLVELDAAGAWQLDIDLRNGTQLYDRRTVNIVVMNGLSVSRQYSTVMLP